MGVTTHHMHEYVCKEGAAYSNCELIGSINEVSTLGMAKIIVLVNTFFVYKKIF